MDRFVFWIIRETLDDRGFRNVQTITFEVKKVNESGFGKLTKN